MNIFAFVAYNESGDSSFAQSVERVEVITKENTDKKVYDFKTLGRRFLDYENDFT